VSGSVDERIRKWASTTTYTCSTQCITAQYSTVQCRTVQDSTRQHSTVKISKPQYQGLRLIVSGKGAADA
jgi:hypothetical protein